MKSLNYEQVNNELNERYKELFNLNIQKKTGQLSKPHLLRITKKNIARLKTRLHELERTTND